VTADRVYGMGQAVRCLQPAKLIRELVDHSYDLVRSSLPKKDQQFLAGMRSKV